MAEYTCLRTSGATWSAVLTSTPAKTFRFDIVDVAADGTEIRILNTDGTATVLSGHGLACVGKRGEGASTIASLAGGTIHAMQRLAANGAVLETITGLDVLAGGPSKVMSFSRPPGTKSSLAWVLEQVEGTGDPAIEAGVAVEPPAVVEPPVVVADGCSSAPDLVFAIDAPEATAGGDVPAGMLDVSAVGDQGHRPLLSGRSGSRAPLLVFSTAVVIGFVAVLMAWQAADTSGLDQLKAPFARPTSIPTPGDNTMTPARVALGRRLFGETRLSANNRIACASCHDPERSFAQAVPFSRGVTDTPLKRHSPTLWNVAWGRAFFWDGRSPTLENQARFPMETADEMGQSIDVSAIRLGDDASYVAAFAAAYPGSNGVTADLIAKAIASYERSLVSPPTRFDRWVAGDSRALSTTEVEGFRVFNGKAGCVSCHSGWAFTDYGFHDIGLPDNDKGRGPVLGLANLDHAFKTPSLRELVWTAPYMHNGSLASLDDVLDHYERGIVDRPTLSPDLKRKLELTLAEREALLAFLKSLSSSGTPKPRVDIEIASSRSVGALAPASQLTTIGQKDKRFAPNRVRIKLGEALVIVNNDTRPHNVSIAHPRMGYSSGLQEPGDQVKIPFPEAGSFEIFCGIHPTMRLDVEVEGPK